MSSELLSPVASNCAVALLAFGKVLAYPFEIADNIKALDCAARQLLALEKDVIAIRNILQSHEFHRQHEVDEWLNQVRNVQNEVEEIEEKYKQTKTMCIWNNFNISRDAAKKLVEVEDLHHNETIKEIMINYRSHHEMPASPQQPGVEINYEKTSSHARFGFAFHLRNN